MVGLRHALVAALVGGALLQPASVEAQADRRRPTIESRRDSEIDRCGTLGDRTRRAAEVILGRDGRRVTRDADCRDIGDRRDDRRDRDCGIIVIGDRRDCRIDDRRDDRRDRRLDGRDRGRRVQRGPAFCRSGAGHPVHGRRWCREKGFGLGSDRLDRRDRRDRRDRDGGIIFRLPDSRRGGVLDRVDLIDILGIRTFSRLEDVRRRHGLRDGTQGRWYRDRAGRDAILISAGGVPIADLVDRGRGYELLLRAW